METSNFVDKATLPNGRTVREKDTVSLVPNPQFDSAAVTRILGGGPYRISSIDATGDKITLFLNTLAEETSVKPGFDARDFQ